MNFLCLSFYIGLEIDRINERLLEVKLPQQIKRNLRPLTERKHYKASEWRTLVLFVAMPILKDILPQRYAH